MPTTISEALNQDQEYFPKELLGKVEPLYPAFYARQFDDLTIYSSLATLESISKGRCAALLLYLSEQIDLNQVKFIAEILSIDSSEVLLIGITSGLSKISPACQDIYRSLYTEQIDQPSSIHPLLQFSVHIKSGIKASYLNHLLVTEQGRQFFYSMLAVSRFKEALLSAKESAAILISRSSDNSSPLSLLSGPEAWPALETILSSPQIKSGLKSNREFPYTLIASDHMKGSLFYWILLNKKVAIIKEFLLNKDFQKKFFNVGTFLRELVKKQPCGSSLLYMIIEESPDMLQHMISHQQLKKRLLASKTFIPTLLSTTPPGLSALSLLLATEEGRESFNTLLIEWKEKLVDDPEFLNAILEPDTQGYSAIINLFRPSAIMVLRNLFTFSAVKKKIITDIRFISALLIPYTNNRRALYELFLLTHEDGSIILIELLKNNTFKKNLFAHPDFVKALFEPVIIINNYPFSLFELLISNNSYAFFLQELFTDPSVTEKMLNDEGIITNLLKKHPTKSFMLHHLIKEMTGFVIFTDCVKNQQFRKNLVSHLGFLDVLYARENQEDIAILEFLLTSNPGLHILNHLLLEDSFKDALIKDKNFIPALLRVLPPGVSGFGVATWTDEGRAVLIPLISQNSHLKQALFSHPHFLDTLCCISNMGVSPFYGLVCLANDIPNEAYLNTPTFLDHLPLFGALLSCRNEPGSAYHNDFALAQMVSRLDVYHSLLKAIFSSAQFKTWLDNPDHLTQFMRLFFTQIDYHPTLHHSIFAWLLLKDKQGEILIQLLSIASVKQEIMTRLNLPTDVSSFLFDLLKVDPGGQLVYALYQHQRTALLKVNSLEGLFLNPQIQTLIRLQHIKPEWFLFLALQGPKPLQAATFFFNQSISPWVTTNSGQYLDDFIKKLAINDDIKAALLQLVERACSDYSHKQLHLLTQPAIEAPPPLPMEVDQASCDNNGDSPRKRVKQQDEREMDRHGGGDAGAAVNRPQESLPPEQRIRGVSDAEIIAFNRTIKDILGCEALKDYHPAFNNLANNGSFRSSLDFPTVKNKLMELSIIMLKSASKNNVPPYDPACSLKECTKEVVDGLSFMHQLFSGGTIALFYRSANQDTITKYNKLLGVAEGNEIHSPDAPLHAILGLPTEFPLHDPFLTRWSLNQIEWVAQDALFVHLKAMPWLRRQLLEPLVTLFVDTFIQQMKLSLTDNNFLPIFDETSRAVIDVFQTFESFEPITPQIDSATIALFRMKLVINLGNIDGESPWYYLINFFNKSPLREKELKLDSKQFFELLGLEVTTEDYFSYFVNIENAHQIIMRFMTMLEKSFQDWYEKQTTLPQPKRINHYSNLLWLFLTDTAKEAQQEEVTALISQLPKAVDACALIKYTITQHHDELIKLKNNQLIRPIEPSDVSIFSILCANPFYCAWIIERPIDGHRDQRGWQLYFLPPQNGSGLSAIFRQGTDNKNSKALLNTLSHKGTLFFQLTVMKVIFVNLLSPIIDFLGLSINLYQYDSLLPVLYDMQHSNDVSHEHKGLVKEFIITSMNTAIGLQENTVYWDLCCTFSPISEDFLKQIEDQVRANPWLTPPSSIRAYLFNQDPEPRLQSAGQLSIFNQNEQPSSAPPSRLSPS